MCDTAQALDDGLAIDGSGRVLIRLGPLLGSDRLADRVVDVVHDVSGRVVVVDTFHVRFVNDEFLDRLLRRLLGDGAEAVEVIEALPPVSDEIDAALARLGSDRVRVVRPCHLVGMRHPRL